MLQRTVMTYDAPGGTYESMLVADPTAGERPGVLLFPNFLGTKEADFARAEQIAAQGYTVLVVDYYGAGKRGTDMASGSALMTELVEDRTLMRDKLRAHLGQLQAVPGVKSGRVGAIGLCLGGKCVLDLARSGADIAGVVMHGVYDAPPFPNAAMTARLLVCHGWNDPLCPPEALVALGQELTAAGVDWTLLSFSKTGHAFTDESTPLNPEQSFGYVAEACTESFAAMYRLFAAEL